MKGRRTNPTGKPAEAGIIYEVHVENFMCHRKLSVKLCRNVNIIHGQNGSGKSAILTAIKLCLGSKHSRRRSRNLKDLIRKDCSGAKLRVTILNKGANGYKPDVYGDYITVERTISMRGLLPPSLLDANGKVRSRTKKDFDAMLHQLNIQVENPVAMLDQEEAKKFLTGNAEDKYAFFTKATKPKLDSMMEQVECKYEFSTKALDSKMEQKNSIDRNTRALRRDLADQKKRWRGFRGHTAEMTNLWFDEILNKCGSAGEVNFDHEAGQLNLSVQKNNKDEHSLSTDLNAQSGGERSFATLALLLAIGETLEMPFRVMDEFDIFLDPLARKIMMVNIVKIAKAMDHRQFIFITPHDVSNLQTGPKLRIFKMKPPVRSNVVLLQSKRAATMINDPPAKRTRLKRATNAKQPVEASVSHQMANSTDVMNGPLSKVVTARAHSPASYEAEDGVTEKVFHNQPDANLNAKGSDSWPSAANNSGTASKKKPSESETPSSNVNPPKGKK
eukprot:CAMPEP_0172314882 /NCGR_PEP_ID=MMETSP1058-20130122/23427_1 /TAXON_ID=83371 /ORGANISM="Detonula confervacea, Strain CCMP 353" /LENGTH=501 /DNA_ID=CAMNT_0013028833 /DNA_START=11 /DNA_END=1513 /DNA_ORIENTATION=-